MFTLDQLRSFIAVAEEMHFGRAAERLTMTQPPLSRQIQALERGLGVQLFDRTRRSIRLTEAGAAFLREARRLLALTSLAAETARRTSLGLAGAVHIGFTSAVGQTVLPSLLQRAAAELDGVDLILHEMVTADQLAGLRDGTLDLGMIRPSAYDEELAIRRLPPERLVMAVPSSWELPIAGMDERRDERGDADALPACELSELSNRDFVMYSEGGSRYFHELLTAVFTQCQVTPRYAQRVTQVHTMLSLVEAGIGAALVPESARRWAPAHTLFVDAPELASFPVESNLIWRKDSANPALWRALQLL
jgi:DNA-binding transcriptional LysR family regulator